MPEAGLTGRGDQTGYPPGPHLIGRRRAMLTGYTAKVQICDGIATDSRITPAHAAP